MSRENKNNEIQQEEFDNKTFEQNVIFLSSDKAVTANNKEI